ncbi:MAG TPA: alpha/beta hydrolase domain-containing protein [Acidimicrobiales bacterium]|nr:alpha/beta hydrolase domain-containing protein [Acidimicrobiales bacterium]
MSAPAPTVVGPILGAQPPWGAPSADVATRGYVVEEYQVEGSVVGYQIAPGTKATIDGRWTVEEVADATYRTRILVVRPERAEHFNGTVVVNWQNVSAGYEIGSPSGDEIFDGYAWVGVSAQEVGLYGFPAGMERFASRRARPLVEHDPQRYGSLFHPGDPASFDIFTQAGRVVGPERSGDVDPMGGLDVRRLIATGGSQSAMRLVAYLNAVHPFTRVFDGFLLSVWEGRAPRPEEGPLPMGVRTSIRTDTPTPVLVVNSEFETPHLAAISAADTDHLRVWEVAGTPHGVAQSHGDHPDSRGRVVNRLSYQPVHEAALRAVHRWLAHGTPAPPQPRIALDPDSPASIRRDGSGNAVGGIRLPELQVPTHAYYGMAHGTGRAPLFGAARPFTHDELRRLYPSHAVYVGRWHAAVDALIQAGALRPEHAPAMKARADEVTLPVD